MQQRKLTFGRPSGTDGSDYSYRMIVDSRYQLVAKGKKRLSVLFIVEALLLLIGVVFAFLPGTKDDTQNKVLFYSVIGSVVLLIIADIGRRRSRPSFLRLYAALSSLLMLLLTASLANQPSLLKSHKNKKKRLKLLAMKLLLRDMGSILQVFLCLPFTSTSVQRLYCSSICLYTGQGLLVYILTLSLFRISTIKAVVFLLFNMTPPKKAS